MKCPQCHFSNRQEVKYCEECGARLRLVCSQCSLEVPLGWKFCGQCGHPLFHAAWTVDRITPAIIGERKQVTVMFSDLSGYTSMTERMDPEDVKEIMSRIFGEITQIVKKYEGFIGRFLGDAAMVLFGIPSSHEDDAVRAIRSAREIHSAVEGMNPDYQSKIGRPLAMHTGINSGLVIISELGSAKTAGELTGDTVNVASRLCSLARAGTILVGPETHSAARAYFSFQQCEPTEVRGRTGPVQPYEVLSTRIKPAKPPRLHSLRAKLIGRGKEMALLAGARERLEQGQRSIVCISGDPGTGKTRLIEEFRATLDRQQFGWMPIYAYGYTQSIPYWPWIDLMNRGWKIEEKDSPDRVREKIELGVRDFLGEREHMYSVVGSLYSLCNQEFESLSPELWKGQLYEAARSYLAEFTRSRPTVICLEDLHWADLPFVDLLRFILTDSTFPALFLCVYRPPIKLFSKERLHTVKDFYREIRLEDLAPAEAQQMMESLLGTRTIPLELKQFIHDKTEGNPFYLEEVINSLTESETLVQENGTWKLARMLSESDISPTIQGVISARLDRLNVEWKRLLQEASVIGRNFLYVILEHITELRDHIHDCLGGLERLDLIRTNSMEPELEYIFKHALTQEVVYSGLLKKERQVVHERIGEVMEGLFRDRLPEMYETLAFHYKQSNSVHKAVDYLAKSGEKSLRKYAVEESHQYFREAYELLTQNSHQNEADGVLLVDLLIKWAFVYYYSGEYRKLQELLEAHLNLSEELADPHRLGMYYAWLSCAYWHREKAPEAYGYLLRALELGEALADHRVIGYAYTWLTWTCIELGRLADAVDYGERAQELCRSVDMEHYVHFNSLAGLAYAESQRGEKRKALEHGNALVEFGQRHSNVRSMVMGHCFIGYSHMLGGDVAAATSSFETAVQIAADPWYSQFPRMALCHVCISHGQYHGLQETLEQIIAFSEERGVEYMESPGKLLLGAVFAAQGSIGRGMKLMEDVAETWLHRGSRFRYANSQLIMGRIYAIIAEGLAPKKLTTMFRNFGFVVTKAPFADRKAVQCLRKAIELAGEMGARDVSARAYFTLGLLHKAKGRHEKARECLLSAVRVFEECEADVDSRKAKEALADLV
jgi:class 3 adenylate cyclase/tetratricopeptide (TPR) repeat protein